MVHPGDNRNRMWECMPSNVQQNNFGVSCPAGLIFCNLTQEAQEAFEAIKTFERYQRGARLFTEGEAARRVFVLRDGRVRISVSSAKERRLVLCTLGPGEPIGLDATLAGVNYEVAAEVIEDCDGAFIRRKDLLQFLRTYPDACLQMLRLLSEHLHLAYDRMQEIALIRARRCGPF